MNNDKSIGDVLKVVFLTNYRVSLAEKGELMVDHLLAYHLHGDSLSFSLPLYISPSPPLVIPATDLSEQVSMIHILSTACMDSCTI